MLRFLAAVALFLVCGEARGATDIPELLRQGNAVLLMRHEATEPGLGDPPEFRLGDCSTQRNLSPEGRHAAAEMGRKLRAAGIPVGQVGTSPWCRCAETADLLGLGPPQVDDALGSFFGDRSLESARVRAIRNRIEAWLGPGVLMLVTHQVNITAVTGIFPAPGEIIALRPAGGGGFSVLGRLRL